MALPNRFRIFKAGLNHSSKGDFLFDLEAAKNVMTHYAKEGVEIMIDLEHLSLDDDSKAYDPDARGWCKLSLINGELWAVDVRWTPEGEARLTSQRQRYISPAFSVDKTSKRIQAVLNLALVAMPATYGAQDLLAASKFAKLSSRFPDSDLATLTLKVNCMPPEILSMLGLSAESTADQFAEALKAVLAKLSTTETPKTPDAAAPMAEALAKLEAKVLALSARVAEGDKAIAKLKELEAKEQETKKAELLAKLPKNLETWGAKQSIAVLEEYVASASPTETSVEPVVTSEVSKLSKEELEACKLTGVSPEKFLEFKLKKAV